MDLQAFESRFAVLDDIPEALFSAIVTHTHGTLMERAAGLMQWRHALLEGRLPVDEELQWPEPAFCQLILKRLEALDIVRYCRDEPTLTDIVLESTLEGVMSADDYFSKAGDFDDCLAQQQKIRDRDSEFGDDEGIADHVGDENDDADAQPPAAPSPSGGEGEEEEPGEAQVETAASADDAKAAGEGRGLSSFTGDMVAADEAVDAIAAEAQASVTGGLPDPLGDALDRRWGKLSLSWQELSGVLDELGHHLGRGWDLTRGILASEGWRDISRYRKLLQDLPELVRLVEMLGRMQGNDNGEREGSMIDDIKPSPRR